MFDIYKTACMCDLADGEDEVASVCALTAICESLGYKENGVVLYQLCHRTFLPSTTSTTTSTTSPLPEAPLEISEVEVAERRFVWEFLLTLVVCLLALLIWYVILYCCCKKQPVGDEEAVVNDTKQVVTLPRDGYLMSTMQFDNPAFNNPRYDERIVLSAPAEVPVERSSHQHDAIDNHMIAMGLFEGTDTAKATAANVWAAGDSADDAAFNPNTALQAAIADLPWVNVAVEITDQDATFSLNGTVLRTNRLPEPIEDTRDDDMVVRVGQRVPNANGFKGEMRNLHFYECQEEVPSPDDPPSANRRPPRTRLGLMDTPVDLLYLGDNPNGTVADGSDKSTKLFNGAYTSYLDVPGAFHPKSSVTRSIKMRISVDVRQLPESSGYIVSKTDVSGQTKFWALGLVSTAHGTSIQFYYHPKGAERGHRVTMASVGHNVDTALDSDGLIDGVATHRIAETDGRRQAFGPHAIAVHAVAAHVDDRMRDLLDVEGAAAAREVEHQRQAEAEAQARAIAEAQTRKQRRIQAVRDEHARAMAKLDAEEALLQRSIAAQQTAATNAQATATQLQHKQSALDTLERTLAQLEKTAVLDRVRQQQLKDALESERLKQRAKLLHGMADKSKAVASRHATALSMTEVELSEPEPLAVGEVASDTMEGTELLALAVLFPELF